MSDYQGLANAQAQQQAWAGYTQKQLSPPIIHYIRETERGPSKETPCGQRLWEVVLWEVVHDLGPVPTPGEFRVHPLTASGLLARVDCLGCLRELAKAGAR
jgi:hypothetical protein